MFCRSKIENNAKGNDILNIVMFLAAKNMQNVMIFLTFCCFRNKNNAKGNDILDILLFLEQERCKR